MWGRVGLRAQTATAHVVPQLLERASERLLAAGNDRREDRQAVRHRLRPIENIAKR